MKAVLITVAIASLIAGFAIQIWLEARQLADSLGLWYTALCALIYGGILTGLLSAIVYLIHRVRLALGR